MDRSGQQLGAGAGPVGGRPSGIDDLRELCGRAGAPPLPLPPGLVATALRLGADLERRSAGLGRRLAVEPLALLAERAVAHRFVRQGAVSCGGSARLVRSADGWLAVNLARPDDWDLVDAWLEPPWPIARGRWAEVVPCLARHRSDELVARSAMLGLPVAAVGERRRDAGPPARPVDDPPGAPGIRAVRLSPAPPPASLDGLVVVDLSALWAGPLAGALLRRAGARVVKVESSSRPDGARRGPPAFFCSLNQGKESVSLAFDSAGGRSDLSALVWRADVVITSARSRALEQLGLVPEARMGPGGPRLWVSITGYGRAGPSADRVAFGDDAAAAGGLVVWDGEGPCFCGDAVADPLSGMAAAAAALAALEQGGRWVLDVSMADVAAGCRVDTSPEGGAPPAPGPAGRRVAPPVTGTEPTGPVAALGSDTESVLAELGIR